MDTDFLIRHIREGHGLEYERVEKRGYMWVSEGMKEEVNQWFPRPAQLGGSLINKFNRVMEGSGWAHSTHKSFPPSPPVLIQAQTGSGKNFFIMNTVGDVEESRGKRVLVLTNRKALCKQQLREADRKNGLPLFGDEVYEDYSTSKNLIILTYQEVIPFLDKEKQALLQTIESVIFDEVHFFFSDSAFNPNTSNIYRRLLFEFFSCKRIYMSATPEDVKPIVALEELRVYAALSAGYNIDFDIINGTQEISRIKMSYNLPKIQEIFFPFFFDYVNLLFFHDWNSIINEIQFECENEISSEEENFPEKWLIFVQTKDEGKTLKKNLGTNADFVCAEEKKDNNIKLQRIVEKKRFDKKVLISTTVLYNGVSIEDSALKHIVVDTLNRTEVIQMLGRKRICNKDDKVNLYIRIPKKEEIESRINYLEKRSASIRAFHKNLPQFFRDNWEMENLPDSTRKLVGPQQGKSASIFGMSDFAAYMTTIEEGRYKFFFNRYEKFTIEKYISSNWFSKEFTPEMYFGETRKEQVNKVSSEVAICIAKYVDCSPISVSMCEELWCKLIEIIEPIRKAEMNVSLKHKIDEGDGDSEKRDESGTFGRILTDIRAIIKFFKLPYSISKKNGKCVLKSTTNNP